MLSGLVLHACTSVNSVCVFVIEMHVRIYNVVYVFDDLWRRVLHVVLLHPCSMYMYRYAYICACMLCICMYACIVYIYTCMYT